LVRSWLAHLAALQVGPQAVIEEVHELPRVPRDRIDELGDLVDEERAEGDDEHDDHADEHGEHRVGGQAAPPTATGEEIGGWFHREGQEERDEKHQEEAAHPHHQPEGEVEGVRTEEEEHDRSPPARRHRRSRMSRSAAWSSPSRMQPESSAAGCCDLILDG
jgi:hypothetical protein